jgi:nitrate reductase NapE component
MQVLELVGALVAALLLLSLSLHDAFEVMLLPRRIDRRVRLMNIVFRAGWTVWVRGARRLPPGQRREHFLSLFGALAMLMLFLVWMIGLISGYGLLLWALEAIFSAGHHPSLSAAFYISAGNFFTVGAGGFSPATGVGRFLCVLAAGSGLGFIAVVIGYLPTLYQLFARREAHIIQLDARAGSPPSAITLITRHAEGAAIRDVDVLLRSWEIWASELLESHLSYPMLAYYRSQHDNQSWLAAMAAIMDTCALVLVGMDEFNPLQARMTFAMARQVVVEMARSFNIGPSRYDGNDRLGPERFRQMEALFAEAGVGWSQAADCEQVLAAVRATYEPLLDGLARYLLLPLPEFLPDATTRDHWERGPRGTMARRLIEDLSDRGAPVATAMDHTTPLWRRVRARLK